MTAARAPTGNFSERTEIGIFGNPQNVDMLVLAPQECHNDAALWDNAGCGVSLNDQAHVK
jgi:hypothetical protein